MSGFVSLATMLEGWFKPLRDLAEELCQRAKHAFFQTPWDDLAPDQRRSVARQRDYQYDPGMETNRKFWRDFVECKNAVERQMMRGAGHPPTK